MKTILLLLVLFDLIRAVETDIRIDGVYYVVWALASLGLWILCRVNDNHHLLKENQRLLEELLKRNKKNETCNPNGK